MSPPLIILRPDDAPRMASLHAAAVSRGWPVQDCRNLLKQQTSLALGIANDPGDTLAAFVICQIVLDTADILMIATDPQYRRRGHARTLMHSLLKRLGERGTGRMTLEVAADNAAAISLYQSLDFVIDGRRPKYYNRNGNHIDAVLMSRPVAGLPEP